MPKAAAHLGEQRGEPVGALGGEGPELLLERRGLDEGEVGERVEVVGDPGLGGLEAQPRGGADR